MLSELLKASQLVAAGTRLARALEQAEDPGAYLRQNAIAHVADLADAAQPGAGPIIGRIADDVRALRHPGTDRTIEGEYRELDDGDGALPRAPWSRLVNWTLRRDYLSCLFLGHKGRGKTWAAHRLAQLINERRGWPVLVTNTYAPDWHRWERPVQPAQYLQWCEEIMAILQRPIDPAATEDETAKWFAAQDYLLDRYQRKILILDEMSMIVHAAPSDPGRRMVDTIQEQLRHLQWCVMYIAQAGKQVTGTLLDADILFFKQPNGDEHLKSSRDADLADLWAAAYDAFQTFRQDPKYGPWLSVYPDNRSWAWAHVKSMDDGRRWQGMVPFQAPGAGR